MLKDGDRVEVIKPKFSWNEKRIMAKVGQKGTVNSAQSKLMPNEPIRVYLDGQRKGIWIRPSHLKRVNE